MWPRTCSSNAKGKAVKQAMETVKKATPARLVITGWAQDLASLVKKDVKELKAINVAEAGVA